MTGRDPGIDRDSALGLNYKNGLRIHKRTKQWRTRAAPGGIPG